eukprot:SAG31_NODE_11792_length_997_cov_49.171492_1_plen_191_part_00
MTLYSCTNVLVISCLRSHRVPAPVQLYGHAGTYVGTASQDSGTAATKFSEGIRSVDDNARGYWVSTCTRHTAGSCMYSCTKFSTTWYHHYVVQLYQSSRRAALPVVVAVRPPPPPHHHPPKQQRHTYTLPALPGQRTTAAAAMNWLSSATSLLSEAAAAVLEDDESVRRPELKGRDTRITRNHRGVGVPN